MLVALAAQLTPVGDCVKEPLMKNPVSTPPSGEARLAELVNAVRAGNPKAVEELQGILAPGVRFLIRRRLIGGGADPHVRSVLDAAVLAIREDPSMASGNVAGPATDCAAFSGAPQRVHRGPAR